MPAKFLTPAWRRLVFPPPPMPVGSVEKRALIVAGTEALRWSLHRHEVFVPGLRKWGDPNARLLDDTAWQAARARVCEELDLDPKPDRILAQWTDRLHQAHREFADGLAANPAVRIEQRGGRDRIILTGLDRLDEPASLVELHKEVQARMPAVDLPEMDLKLFEIPNSVAGAVRAAGVLGACCRYVTYRRGPGSHPRCGSACRVPARPHRRRVRPHVRGRGA
nr:hypothetical protein [Streptomyces sp. 846.5]